MSKSTENTHFLFDENYIILVCRCVACEITFEAPAKRQISADMFKGIFCPECGDKNPNVIRSKGSMKGEML